MTFFVIIWTRNRLTYFLYNIQVKSWKPWLKITKISMLYFWSRDGIQIFSLDLVLDLLIGRHLILPFPQTYIKNCDGHTDCKSLRGDTVHFSSPVGLLLGLVLARCCLSVSGLWLVLVVSSRVMEKISRPPVRSAPRSRQAWMYYVLLGRWN